LRAVAAVFLAVLLILVCCAPAQAATTVARSGEFELDARQQDGRLCMTLRRACRYQGQVCGRIPRSPQRPLAMFPDVGFNIPCAPRRALAYGRFPDRLRAPRVVLDGGRTVRSRTISLRGEDAWVAFLPDAAVRGLRAGSRRVPLRLPPASAQCGHNVERVF
jgi:hypothetical protein